jgi:hypothetical protein
MGARFFRPATLLMALLTVMIGLAGSGCAPRGREGLDLSRALADVQQVFSEPRLGVSGMISSYDRMGGNIDWGDPKQLWIGEDRYVLADLTGPGCVKRIWITNVNAEEWLFYFDGESEPRIRMAERDLFAIEKPGLFPFVPPLADAISGGSFSYIPLPYQKSLKIVVRIPNASVNARPYFHVNFVKYAPGTPVDSFPKKMSATQKADVEKTQACWNSVEETMRAVAKRQVWMPLTASPGGTTIVWRADARPGTVQTLAIRLGEVAGQDAVQRDRALRNLVLRCFWDGTSAPSVEVPLGDFFCNGLHPRRFASLPMAQVDGVMICRFPMSFRNGARIEIENGASSAVPFEAAVEEGAQTGPSRYFHAAFSQAVNAGVPLRVMRTEGRGAFMGCYVIALGMDGGWNILEGDEKFFRDGELRPVHHGTGLEDYFNCGWYYYGLVERPFHGLLEKAAMRTAQYRFQIPDPVTFEKSLLMQFEFGDGNRAKGYMSAASYWYQDTPGPAGSTIPAVDERFPPPDRVGVAASMCEIFELERAGLGLEAEQRSAYYAALFGNDPLGSIYALRAAAYREIREGPDAVRDFYRLLAEKPGLLPEIAEQAKLLLWRSEKPGRALFGGCANDVAFRLFADGQKVGEGGHPFVYQAFPVELAPGDHMLRVEVQSKGAQAWYALGFFSDFTNVVSDVSWDFSLTKPEGWPSGDGDPALWKPYETASWYFPNMQWWQLSPNAFPCVQSGQQVGGPAPGWEKPVGRTVYLRRRVTVPTEPGPRCNPFRRRKEIRVPPVRPVGDTSNDGLSR